MKRHYKTRQALSGEVLALVGKDSYYIQPSIYRHIPLQILWQ